jgi:glycosyltransferase involved in cell wall biosynthesis
VIVVRAIGNQQHDSTLDIALKRGCKIDRYFNAKGNDWPHVDDFAAARNKACDFATGDWLMWADTDDIITPESIAQIKAIIQDIPENVDGVLMRYVVPEDGIINWRERLWRRGSARWENPIHECLKFRDGANHIRFEGAEIVHASEKRSASRDDRNLRILENIPSDKRTISQHFHVFQSLIALDRNAEAIPKAIEFVGMEGVGKNERYEAFFQLARLAGDPEYKHAMLLQALATDPTRREAYGELGLACVPNDAPAALGWTTAMGALSLPKEAPWNLRRSYYGQLGIHLHGMALRVNNRQEEADKMEHEHFVRNGAKISLLHATRGRPAKAWRCRMDWLRAASSPDAIEHIFGVDSDDPASFMLTATRHVVSWPDAGPVGAWNAAAKASSGQVLVQLSDDWEPIPGWDLAILEAIGDTSKTAVLAVSDGHRKDDLLCMAILTRARYEAQGYLFHPEFFSMFSDNWFSREAFADCVVIDARDRITFEHRHPAFGKAEMDDTYARSNASEHYEKGAAIFEKLANQKP